MAIGPEEALAIYSWGRWTFEHFPIIGRKYRRMRQHHLMLHYRQLHKGVMHAMRDLAGSMVELPRNPKMVGRRAVDLCGKFREGMGNLLELSESQLNCCMKVNLRGTDGKDLFATWARADPGDTRKTRDWHSLDCASSTIFASLRGESDGNTSWKQFPSFCCNDLEKYAIKFKCNRSDWSSYYLSTFVLPLRFIHEAEDGQKVTDNIGFLAFDSPKKQAFEGVPEIYEYVGNPQGYRDALEKSAAFHLGAIYADAWSTFMHGLYDPAQPNEGDYYGTIPKQPPKRERSTSGSDSTGGSNAPGDGSYR